LGGSIAQSLGTAEAEARAMTVWIYVDTSKEVGDRDHLKVFARQDAAEKWLRRAPPNVFH
jgi:hypothetical protein